MTTRTKPAAITLTPAAEQRIERIQKDGFAGPGFTGEHRESTT